MLNLNVKKSSTNGSISATVLRQNAEIHLPFLTKSINKSYAYEKWSPKRRPSKEGELQSLLPHILQVFERIIYMQITNYVENKLSN